MFTLMSCILTRSALNTLETFLCWDCRSLAERGFRGRTSKTSWNLWNFSGSTLQTTGARAKRPLASAHIRPSINLSAGGKGGYVPGMKLLWNPLYFVPTGA